MRPCVSSDFILRKVGRKEMLRDIDLNEVSDGKLYSANDLAKVDCGGCQGCSTCCQGMGSSIQLDPLDFYRLYKKLHVSPEELLGVHVELNVVDGLVIPNLKMDEERDACTFLDENGRCKIHDSRPGFCRMFPLGRVYEEDGFYYFLQIHECPKPGKTKMKVKKWIDTPNLKQYETFVMEWHIFTKKLQNYLQEIVTEDHFEEIAKKVYMYVLKVFYLAPYDENVEFYLQFYQRLETAKAALVAVF